MFIEAYQRIALSNTTENFVYSNVKLSLFKIGFYNVKLHLECSPVTIYGFLQNPDDGVFLLAHEDVQIAVDTRNRYVVLFNYVIDGCSNCRVLTLPHTRVADGIPLSE